jgi:DNA (cytosine-5)-methyltransferase 1
MDICVRRLGLHRGAPRLYLDSPALGRAGFEPGARIKVRCEGGRVVVEICSDGDRRVSRKTRGAACVPVIDINSQADLGPVMALGVVRVVYLHRSIHILALASEARAMEREARLLERVRAQQPLRCASIAFGAGITSWALHAGLADTGASTCLDFVNEVDENLVDHGTAVHPLIGPTTVVVNASMQEAVADGWLLRRLGTVEILEAGIPCSGASRAGAAKRGLSRMEDHPLVGHLVASVIQWIAALQPAIFLAENVPDYPRSASASILRAWLRDAGYAVQELILEATDFGSLEARRRWFLVAHPLKLELQPDEIRAAAAPPSALGDLLDDVPEDDPSWRPVKYLKDKELRDAGKSNGFAMQWLTPASTKVPTLRKGYHKGGSTDPRLLHPTMPNLSRLLTPCEHARIKGIPEQLLAGLSATAAHQACGQSVDTRPVRAIGQWLGAALRRASSSTGTGAPARSTNIDVRIAA